MAETLTTLVVQGAFLAHKKPDGERWYIQGQDIIPFDEYDKRLPEVIKNLIKATCHYGHIVEISLTLSEDRGGIIVSCFAACTEQEYNARFPSLAQVAE